MNSDFSQPQRQSAYGIIIMTAHTALKIVKAFAFPLILAFVKLPRHYAVYSILVLAAIVLISALFAYLWYLRFTFFLDQEKQEFIVNKGILNRDQLTIQLDKIQQVNINQSILQKIIGIYGLKIDTAGAKGEEVNIRAISESAAYTLKAHLLNRSANTETTASDEVQATPDEKPFLRISATTLLKVGLTSNYLQSFLLLLAFVYTVIYEGRQFMDAFDMDKDALQNSVTAMLTLFSVIILIVVILILLLIINLVRTFYKFFELEISRHQHALLLSSGLIAKKTALADPKKIQITRYSQNYFQKKIGILNMVLQQAHSGKHKAQGSILQIPGCNPSERDQLLEIILSKMPEKGKQFVPDWRFLNLPVLFRLILPILIFVCTAFYIPELRPYIGFTAVYFAIGFILIYISYTRHRIFVSEDFIIKRSGIWDVSEDILNPHKIQSITTFQYPWHKGIDVGHLCLHTAAGDIRFKYGNYSKIKQLVNYWLYQVESGNEDWM